MAAAIEEAIQAVLAAALVGIVGTRIYPDVAAEDATLPLVIYQCVGRTPYAAMNEAAGLHECRFQVDGWAATRIGARTLADAIRAALDKYSGVPAGVQVEGVTFESEATDMEPAVGEEAGAAYNVRQEYSIWVKE